MKKNILLLVFAIMSTHIYSQKAVSDKAVHAQTRRNVYRDWGDWQPKAKKVLGININPNHEMVWGWTAPAFGGNKTRNKNYQKKDIRPLSATGKETQRVAFTTAEKQYAKEAAEITEEIQENYLTQLALNEGTLSEADPFYIIYFKNELRSVENFSQDKILNIVGDQEVYSFLNETGFIEKFNKSMNILKDRCEIAKTTTIERGQRIIFYHNILSDYRKELDSFKNHIRTTSTYLSYKKKHNGNIKMNHNDLSTFSSWNDKDIQIALKVIEQSKFPR